MSTQAETDPIIALCDRALAKLKEWERIVRSEGVRSGDEDVTE
jgi:hypothetical protein